MLPGEAGSGRAIRRSPSPELPRTDWLRPLPLSPNWKHRECDRGQRDSETGLPGHSTRLKNWLSENRPTHSLTHVELPGSCAAAARKRPTTVASTASGMHAATVSLSMLFCRVIGDL
jgi:hypothetical protein